MHEDKQKICDLLLPALQATSNLHDLASLKYERIGDYDEIEDEKPKRKRKKSN